MISVDQVIHDYFPQQSRLKFSCLQWLLRKMLHEQAFVNFAEEYPHLRGIEFVEQVLEYFDFSFTVSDQQRENIPTTGKVVIIANHPIGSLDGMAMLKMVHEVRSDVKIVANDLLMSIEPMRSLLLPVRNMTGGSGKRHLERIAQWLADDGAVIIFPAGEVSRLSPRGIRDCGWQRGFLKIAERAKAPILPVHISGRNSLPFYLTSLVARPLSTLMLVGEMFRQQSKQLEIVVGELISYRTYANLPLRRAERAKLFKKHVYRIGQGKKPLLATESAIARPERKADLKRAIADATQLGRTPDGKLICLFDPTESSPLLREIGRLREQAFRAVGEGCGKRRDLDRFDWYYRHLILWDEDDLEIAGAYRFCDAARVVEEKGVDGLYTTSLFRLERERCSFLAQGLELGRSFVQQRYWGKRSLDYLWYGIGTFLAANPQYRYLFGPVSISDAMVPAARELLVYFYKLYFAAESEGNISRNPFSFSLPKDHLAEAFSGNDYRGDLRRLKSQLAHLGTAIPPLYKQYAELCEPGGVRFLDFNIDPLFGNCVDGLVIVDITRLKEQKRQRYLEGNILRSA